MKLLRIACAAVLILNADPTPLEARAVASSFDQRSILGEEGGNPRSVDPGPRRAVQRLGSLSLDALALGTAAGSREVREGEVPSTRQRRGDSLKNGAIIGAATGAAYGVVMLALGASLDGVRVNAAGSVMPLLLFAGIGAATGAGLDALSAIGSPAVAAGHDAGIGVSVHSALGSNLNGGGSSRALSAGYSPARSVDILVGVERMHIPTKMVRDEYGFSASRGGTTSVISGEVRFAPVTFNRVWPYGLLGAGRGTARPNVNDIFPDSVTLDAMVLFTGGGARVALTRHLSAFADLRVVLQLESSESGVYGFLPVRGGLAWRF